ncbi:MAG TPA: bifunctional (p)ppGpp synthetase/guanosine-3',5'-bis(diphosphate) 3'-pyrophosphohydrolase [Deltaproteobacteria bacterium]|nr:bifunctional (p)ppGpp synthetase/guanosine-3',5'-bis(diphosphate) 3'-pyrophosphohydrolase [Deltaproteobacteria bacterium]
MIGVLRKHIRDYVAIQGSEAEQQLLEQALADIERFHGGQLRRSGQPVIIHPLRVARYICQAGLDAPTVIASLLHDTLEDTPMTRDYVAGNYGEWYAEIVDGLTKIKSPEIEVRQSAAVLEATYQKMLKAMARDVRALFIKIFDRLDNMRDMGSMPRKKQRRISLETMGVYVPMAERLGLWEISREHTELCFQILYPNRYTKTVASLERLKEERSVAIETMRQHLGVILEPLAKKLLAVEPIFSQPSDYIFRSTPVEHVLEGFQIMVAQPIDCYQALGHLHTALSAIPRQVRDYVSNSRWNGYQALRTALLLEGERVTVEIVSRQMRERNRHGIMAYWSGTPSELADYYKTYLDQLDQVAGESDLRMNDVLRSMQDEQVQVFSPKGELFALPKGSIVLDFAYCIHTDLGNHCIGAMLNPSRSGPRQSGTRVPRDRQLRHGESLRILTDPNVRPSRDWLQHAVAAKSQIQIKHAIAQQKATRARRVGREVLVQELRRLQIDPETWFDSESVQEALASEHLTPENFLQEIGLQKREVAPFLKRHKLVPEEQMNTFRELLRARNWGAVFRSRSTPSFYIEDVGDPLIHFGTCCNPVPGDRIVGFSTDAMEVEIHRAKCPQMAEFQNHRPVSVQWRLPKDEKRRHLFEIGVVDGPGILFQITKVIKEAGVAIEDSVSAVAGEGQASIRIRVEPVTWSQYSRICHGLRGLKFVKRLKQSPLDGTAPMAGKRP